MYISIQIIYKGIKLHIGMQNYTKQSQFPRTSQLFNLYIHFQKNLQIIFYILNSCTPLLCFHCFSLDPPYQTRCKVDEPPLYNRSFIEFGTEEQRRMSGESTKKRFFYIEYTIIYSSSFS